jgi:competence protein ComEC
MPILDPYLFQMYQILILSIERLDAWYVSIHVKDLTEIVLMILLIVFFYVLRSQTPYIFIKRVLFSLCFMGISLISFKDMGIYVYALDTGQGDSNVIFSKDCTIVIDAFQYVEETLLGLGVKSIDYVFITHNDIDHVKELNRLDRVFKIKHVISNPYTRLPVKNQMFVEIPYTLTCGDLNIHLLGPLKDYKNDNDNSLNIKVEMYDKKILFMGDSSKDVELDLMNQYDDF